MKYIKSTFILLLALFISGCSIKYTLIINDNYLEENIAVVVDDNSENNADINKEYNPLHHSDDIKYDKTVRRKDGKVYVNLHYRYSFEDFNNANSLNNNFYKRIIKIDDDYFYINLSDFEGFVPEIDFDINLKTNNKVIENNADEVKGNLYIWHVKGKNKGDLNVKIKIARGTTGAKNVEYNYIAYIIIGLLLIVGLIIMLGFIKKYKNKNNF